VLLQLLIYNKQNIKRSIMKKAFTMLEIVFVIVILGILASVAIPRLSGVTNDAEIAKGQADVATIRSAIMNERQTQLIKGITTYIPTLSNSSTKLFTGDGNRTLMQYGVRAGSGSGKWQRITPPRKTSADSYNYRVGESVNRFDYNVASGLFECTSGIKCAQLTQ
jgi:general secretion pathway protein G